MGKVSSGIRAQRHRPVRPRPQRLRPADGEGHQLESGDCRPGLVGQHQAGTGPRGVVWANSGHAPADGDAVAELARRPGGRGRITGCAVPSPQTASPAISRPGADGPGIRAAAGADVLLAGVLAWVMLSCLVLAPLPPVCVVSRACASAPAAGDTAALLRDYAARPQAQPRAPSGSQPGVLVMIMVNWWRRGTKNDHDHGRPGRSLGSLVGDPGWFHDRGRSWSAANQN
jgi:hypothetical protein